MVEKRVGKHMVVASEVEPAKGELRKAVDAIYVYPHQGKLNLVTRKAFNLLLARAMEAGVEDDWYEIPINELARDIRFDSKDMKYLEETLNAMQVTLLKWDVIEASTTGEKMHVRDYVQLLGGVRLIGGVDANGRATGIARTVRYQFDKRVKQRLLVPEVYARINLQLQTEFSSSYTLALYELLIRYKSNIGSDGWAYTVKLPWREWRNLILGGDHASTYEQYKYFSRDVLNKALKELNDVVDEFEFEVTVFRKGRSVDKLQFRIRGKAQRSLGLSTAHPLIDTEEISARLRRIGLRPEEIDKVIKAHDLVLVEDATEQTEMRVRRSDLSQLNKPAAYFHDALKRARSSGRSSAEDAGEKTATDRHGGKQLPGKVRGRKPEASKEDVIATKEGWEAVEEQFLQLPQEERDQLISEFAESLENPVVIKQLSKGGTKPALVRAAFIPWLKRKLEY